MPGECNKWTYSWIFWTFAGISVLVATVWLMVLIQGNFDKTIALLKDVLRANEKMTTTVSNTDEKQAERAKKFQEAMKAQTEALTKALEEKVDKLKVDIKKDIRAENKPILQALAETTPSPQAAEATPVPQVTDPNHKVAGYPE